MTPKSCGLLLFNTFPTKSALNSGLPPFSDTFCAPGTCPFRQRPEKGGLLWSGWKSLSSVVVCYVLMPIKYVYIYLYTWYIYIYISLLYVYTYMYIQIYICLPIACLSHLSSFVLGPALGLGPNIFRDDWWNHHFWWPLQYLLVSSSSRSNNMMALGQLT